MVVAKEVLASREERTAIEALYREHGDRLWRALLAYSGDPDIASDALVEAFAQALRRGAELTSPLGWIWRSAFRLAAGELADRRRPPPALPREQAGSSGADLDLIVALRRISPKQRAAVLLHHYAGYSVREVASLLDSTAGAVRVHLSVGRRRLRELLEEGDG